MRKTEVPPPEDLRVPLFVKACDLLSAKQLFFEASPAAVRPLMAIPRNQQ